MAMTAQELIDRSLLLLAAGDINSPWLVQEAEASLAINQALEELGREIADDSKRFGLTMQDYPVTIDPLTGAGSLVGAVGSSTGLADMIWEKVHKGRVKDNLGVRLIYIPEIQEFEGMVLPGQNYYTIYQNNIYTRGSQSLLYNSDRTALASVGDGTVTVTANFYPSIGSAATLPIEVEDDAVRFLARTLTEKFPSMPSRR